MSPAASGRGSLLARSLIENWDIDHLETAATRWRASAAEFEELFAQHRQNISAPGGTEWEGTAKDTAVDRVNADSSVVSRHGEIVRAAADLADSCVGDLRAAQRTALTAIAEAVADGFRVGEDLTVTDTRRIDVATMAARYAAAREHAENIQWNASQLLATDTLVGERLQAKATELGGITFDSDGHDPTIQTAGWAPWKQNPEIPIPPVPQPPPAQGPVVRGLPPLGVNPPVPGPLTVGPASRASEQKLGGKSLWDEKGGEWRYSPADKYHNPHWDYNTHDNPRSRWNNVEINNVPTHTSRAAPKSTPVEPSAPKAPVEAPRKAPAEAPAPKAPVDVPRMPRGPMIGGGPGIFGPELVPLPHSENDLPILGGGEAEDDV